MAFVNPYQMYLQQMQQQFQPAPQMTLPTIHADIIQVNSADDVERFPVGVGASQMFILRDDSTIYVKTGTVISVYERKQQATQPAPTYITREELEERLSAFRKETTE